MGEFETIHDYFKPLTMGREEAGGLMDDAAVLHVPDGFEVVVSSDSLSEGVHFIKNEEPANIAHKAMRVNLSDMAAMGAVPYCYQLNLSYPGIPSAEWMKTFSAALLSDQQEYGGFCSGGDTTVTDGPLVLSMTMMGLVQKGKAVRRSGAKAGDAIVITGCVGDALVGLKILMDVVQVAQPEVFTNALRRPSPRTAIAEVMQQYAHAAIDISDGVLADLGHICNVSGLHAYIEYDKVPLSAGGRDLISRDVLSAEDLLTGGDDYELVIAVPPENLDAFIKEAQAKGVVCSVVGSFEKGAGVTVVDSDGQEMKFSRSGFTHF